MKSARKATSPSDFTVSTTETKFANEISSEEQRELHKMLKYSVKVGIPLRKRFFKNLEKCIGSSADLIAQILLKADCSLSDVINLQNADLTKAFLNRKVSIDTEDSRNSVNQVINLLDVENAGVILQFGPDTATRITLFFYILLSMMTDPEHKNLNTVDVFLKQIIKWNILDEYQLCRAKEQRVFKKLDMASIQKFLHKPISTCIEEVEFKQIRQGWFALSLKKSFGHLKRMLFDAKTSDRSALHNAVKNNIFSEVKYLLDRGADPNSNPLLNGTPLVEALHETNVDSLQRRRCVEILLQYGADPLLDLDGWTFADDILYFEHEHLVHLTLAHVAIREANGALVPRSVDRNIDQKDLREFYDECLWQLEDLKVCKIRDGLTMFTIISETGRTLFQFVNERDRKFIVEVMNRYSAEGRLNSLYCSTLREHLRQLRVLDHCRNQAISVISENVNIPSDTLVSQIVSHLTYEDLVLFQ